jgi:hypothetical protein
LLLENTAITCGSNVNIHALGLFEEMCKVRGAAERRLQIVVRPEVDAGMIGVVNAGAVPDLPNTPELPRLHHQTPRLVSAMGCRYVLSRKPLTAGRLRDVETILTGRAGCGVDVGVARMRACLRA